MKVITNFSFLNDDIRNHLKVEDSNTDIINYESFMLVDPITNPIYPEFDKPFFDRMNATLKHILYQYKKGWIQSERQIFYTSNECLTTIQFVYREDRVVLNVFQRSSNINNLVDDITFLSWFLENEPDLELVPVEMNIFVSMPHEFRRKQTKVG